AIFLLFLDSDHVVSSIDPDHVDEIRSEPYRGLEFHPGKEKTAITRDRKDLFGWTNEGGRNRPRKRHSQCLLAIADQNLSCAEAIEMSRHPEMKGTHIQTKSGVGREHVL